MKTRVYIDGYNLYYGCLKKTPYKWLDLAHLFENYIFQRSSLTDSSYLHPLDGIKFYTAEISDKAAIDKNSVNDQRSYHAALRGHSSNTVKIIKGSYAIDKVDSRKVEYGDDNLEKKPKDCEKIKTWKIEEKQSDVNVALDAVYDAFCDHSLNHIVFVTNDTDIAPALLKLRELNKLNIRQPIKIGLVNPRKQFLNNRSTNKTLMNLADWHIDYILNDELANSQLPPRITGGQKVAIRPTEWFEHPNEIKEILDILSAVGVCDTYLKAWRWLTTQKPSKTGLQPLANDPSTMLYEQEDIKIVLEHAKAFAEYKLKLLEN